MTDQKTLTQTHCDACGVSFFTYRQPGDLCLTGGCEGTLRALLPGEPEQPRAWQELQAQNRAIHDRVYGALFDAKNRALSAALVASHQEALVDPQVALMGERLAMSNVDWPFLGVVGALAQLAHIPAYPVFPFPPMQVFPACSAIVQIRVTEAFYPLALLVGWREGGSCRVYMRPMMAHHLGHMTDAIELPEGAILGMEGAKIGVGAFSLEVTNTWGDARTVMAAFLGCKR